MLKAAIKAVKDADPELGAAKVHKAVKEANPTWQVRGHDAHTTVASAFCVLHGVLAANANRPGRCRRIA